MKGIGMKKKKIKKLARRLHKNREVAFMTKGLLYRIWWSDGNGGWYIETYEPFSLCQEKDGGLCTGSAKDAIEFMLKRRDVCNLT